MATAFDRDALLDAFDRIGYAAVEAKTRLQIAVYGGSALMLASNFRFATEDVDIADIGAEWPDWLTNVVADIARDKGWGEDWFNDGVTFHLSALADVQKIINFFGTFPRRGEDVGLTVFIPSLRYMLAMKLKSLRVADFRKGELDLEDVSHLLRAANVTDVEQAIDILRDYFPRSAADADKQRFVVKGFCPKVTKSMRPNTLAEAIDRIQSGQPFEKAFPEFLDSFYLARDNVSRAAMIHEEPQPMSEQEDALMGAVAEYLAHQYALADVPLWAFAPSRYLARPWHTSRFEDDGMREYLTFASPAEFASRNIFTEERPLRRARGPAPGKPDIA